MSATLAPPSSFSLDAQAVVRPAPAPGSTPAPSSALAAPTLQRPATGGERSSGNWWYAFGRWLPIAAQDDDFVLA